MYKKWHHAKHERSGRVTATIKNSSSGIGNPECRMKVVGQTNGFKVSLKNSLHFVNISPDMVTE